MTKRHAVVVGAGPVGCVLAILMERRGFEVDVYEKRSDLRRDDLAGGRSINLVLTNRGLRALDLIGLRSRVLELTVPVLGRMMHSADADLTYQPYGKDDSEHNHSVSRGELNAFLLSAAEARGVTFHFDHEVTDVDFESHTVTFLDEHEREQVRPAPVLLGADGVSSAVRKAMVHKLGVAEEIAMLPDGYKELAFPAASAGGYAMAGHALHIWPRDVHMLMGLANLDGSFTGTVYMPNQGDVSFASIQEPEEIRALFEREYPDAIALMPEFVKEWQENPVGMLGTVKTTPWNHEHVVLVGDASHGIVPFFGQGLNSGLEDCAVLYALMEAGDDQLDDVFARFFELRKRNTDAIAAMALENYEEMADHVGDPRFLLRKQVERQIERALPHKYRSRYATVVYSSIGYADAFDAGLVQHAILEELLDAGATQEDPMLELAQTLIDARLTPLYEARGITLDF